MYFSFVYIFFAVFLTLLGFVIGSFLNVVIYRTPMGRTIVSGHSMCMTCSHELAAKDLVPVFSWLFLRGKCRYCGAPVPSRYCKIESLTGAFFLLATLLHMYSITFFELFTLTGNFNFVSFALFAYHFLFLLAGCFVISAMMIWHDTKKCFWRLPVITICFAFIAQILVVLVTNKQLSDALAFLGLKALRLVVLPLIAFIVFKIFRKPYGKNELTLDLTFGGILLFSSYLMFNHEWIATIIFALAFSILRALSVDKKLDKYVGIIGASVVVIFMVISYIV